MKIKQFVNRCLHEALGERKEVSLVIDAELDTLDYSSVFELTEEARLNGMSLPDNWGMPILSGGSIEDVMRSFLSQLILSMAYEGLKLERIGDVVVFPGQIS